MNVKTWSRPITFGAAAVAAVAVALGSAPAAGAHPGDGHGNSRGSIELPGDPVNGSKYEGIGLDERSGTFYVSEITGGEISRGNIHQDKAEPWLASGTDDRFTARGITVDRQGRVYIAGGPNGVAHPGADLWVYSRGGDLLAKLDTGEENAFINDVAIGPDGAAYFTNSNAPKIFRVAQTRDGWGVSTFVDASDTIATVIGPGQFNLGGIVATPDGKALVVAQGNLGLLWRVDLRSRAVSQITGVGADKLTDADGLVLRGNTLLVIRNNSQSITTAKLGDGWTTATLRDETATDSAKVFTTGKLAGSRLYVVSSHFNQTIGTPPFEVVVLKVR